MRQSESKSQSEIENAENIRANDIVRPENVIVSLSFNASMKA